MENLLKNPLGIHSFPEIIKGGYAYVDKTRYIKQLTWNGKSIFFARPNGFGKTLLLSTLQAYFEGRRELFKGLDIDSMDVKWISSPVIRIDLGNHDYSQPGTLENVLDVILGTYERQYDCKMEYTDPAYRLYDIVKAAYNKTGQGVVVLIDDLDKPMLDTVENKETLDTNERILKNILSRLKSLDRYLRYYFITGTAWVIRGDSLIFRVNISNISIDDEYAELCGFSEKEIAETYNHELEALAQSRAETVERTRQTLVDYYGGYRFASDPHYVCNPLSVLKSFRNKDIRPYLNEVNLPRIMTRIFKSSKQLTVNMGPLIVEERCLLYIDLENPNAVLLTFHFGFLAINGNDEFYSPDLYSLAIPNQDAKEALKERISLA